MAPSYNLGMGRLLSFSILAAAIIYVVSSSEFQITNKLQSAEKDLTPIASSSRKPSQAESKASVEKSTENSAQLSEGPPKDHRARDLRQDGQVSELEQCMAKLQPLMKTEEEFIEQNKESLGAVVGGWYFGQVNSNSEVPAETTKAGRFLQALAQSGLLEGRTLPQDESHALNLLYQVMDEDPDNSAPILYASVIEKRRGNDEAYRELLERLSRTKRYDSYVRDFSTNLFSNLRDPRDYFAAIGIWSRAPFPNMREIRDVLENLKSAPLAEQLMTDGLEAGSQFMELSWSPVEYGTGYRLMKTLGLENSYPHPRELMSKSVDAFSRLQEKVDGSHCQLEDLVPMMESQRFDAIRRLSNGSARAY